MNSKIIYIIIFFGLVSFQCKEKKEPNYINLKNKSNMITDSLYNDSLIFTLKNQLKFGKPLNDDFYKPYEASEKDYYILAPFIKKILLENGYKFIGEVEFGKKVNNIFNRKLDYGNNNKFIYVNFLEKCNLKPIFYENNIIDNYGFIINKENFFISDFYLIPEILDYKKFTGITEYEASLPNNQKTKDGEVIPLNLWKDEENLQNRRYFNQQLLIHRNKYLFNNHKVSLVWLKANDAYFLESLVTTFGYTEDADLVAWVMKRNQDKAEQFLKENLFVKNCKGELEIRKGILKYIGTHTNEDEKTQQYAQALHRFDYEDKKWSKNERFKIIAYIGSTFDELFKKSETLGNTNKGRISFLGTVFVKSLHEDNEKTWQELEKNFKENNYYNLQNLKQLTSDAVEFESFPVRGSRWEE